MALKAFQVQDNGEGHGCIMFAEHRATAQRNGANELDREFNEVWCRRAPEYDAYAERGSVPKDVLLLSGWWFTCHAKGCGRIAHEAEGCEPVVDGDAVYCSRECHDSRLAHSV